MPLLIHHVTEGLLKECPILWMGCLNNAVVNIEHLNITRLYKTNQANWQSFRYSGMVSEKRN